jgi:hypothetical protein
MDVLLTDVGRMRHAFGSPPLAPPATAFASLDQGLITPLLSQVWYLYEYRVPGTKPELV